MAVSGEEYLCINDLSEVYQECKNCSNKWEEIGLNLGILKPSIDIIQTDNHNCEQCMIEMLSKWLKKENKECIRSWRSLCKALCSVDRATADQIAKKHHVTDYAKQKELSYQTRSSGISEIPPHIRVSSRVPSQPDADTSDDHYMYLKEMCGCKKCTVKDLKQGRRCETPIVVKYPKLVLLKPNQKIAERFNHTLDKEIELYARTTEIDEKFRECFYLTCSCLKCEVEGNGQKEQRGPKQDISDIVMKLCSFFSVPLPVHVTTIQELIDLFMSKLRVSWFNFEPVRFIATQQLGDLYPEVIQEWEDYDQDFKKYCSERNLGDYARILFNEENGNIFIIEIDEEYYEMKLSDISLLRKSLSRVLGCKTISVHLITVEKCCLLLSFCYCCDDYLNKFNLTPRQLKSLAEIKLCKITSLKDKNNLFVYNNIQSCKILPLECGFEESEQPNKKSIVAKSVGHKTKKTVSTVEQLDLEISEKQLQVILNNFPGTSTGLNTSRTMSIIEQLDLEISEKQLQVILNNYPVLDTEGVEIQTLTEESRDVIMKEPTQIEQELQRKFEIEKKKSLVMSQELDFFINKSLVMSQELDFLRNEIKRLDKKLALTSTLSLDEEDKQTMEVEKDQKIKPVKEEKLKPDNKYEEDVKTMEVEEDYQMTQKIESVEKEQPKPDTEKELLPKSGFSEMSECIHALPPVSGQPGQLQTVPDKITITSKESETSDVTPTLVPIPSKPGQPKAVSVTHNSVDLMWSKPAQYAEYIMNYHVSYCSQEQSKEWLLIHVRGEKETVTVTGLSPKTTYLFKVQAVNQIGFSEMSEVSTPVCTSLPVPSQPGQPQAVDISHDKVRITWTKPQLHAEYVLNYTIHYIRKSDKHGWRTVKTEGAEEELIVSGLEPNTSYIFKVQAESVDGSSKESETSNMILTLVPIPSKPGQPKVHVVSVTHNSVDLMWSKPALYSEYIINYHVSCYFLKEERMKECLSLRIPGEKESITVTGLYPKTTYLFKVQAQSKTGYSEMSEVSMPICTHPPVPSQPGQPQAVNISYDKVKITWAKPQEYAEHINSYSVNYTKNLEKHDWTTVKTESAVEVIVVSGLEISTEYIFKVQAESADGTSIESETSAVIKTKSPVPSPPGKPTCKAKAHDHITLIWSKPTKYYENVKCYKISYYDDKIEKTKITDGRVEEIVIDGLDPQQGYYFKVQANSGFGNSLNSLSSDLIGTNPLRPVLKIIPHCTKLQDSPTVYHLSMTKLPTIEKQKYAKFEYGKASYAPNKVLMLVGATGSGKSTLINGMVNHLLGVEWDDEFRLKLIHDEVETQTKSVTKLISAYTFHKQDDFPLPYSLTIVDTPGFGDTEGIEKDQKITRQIKQFFTEHIDHLDGIGFVAQSGQARLTKTQIYIFNSIFSIFGKDMKDSIFTMVTFADSANPPVIGAIKEAEIPCTEHFQFNNSALYTDERNEFAKMFWDMGAKSFNEFFDKFGKVQSVSLTLTNEVLNQREHLETNIVGLQQLIRAGMSMIDSLKQQQQILKQNESKIKANEDFEFEVVEDNMTKIDLNPKEYVTNCLICNFTCHYPCPIPGDENKYRCAAMKLPKNKDTTCTVCPGKCAWDKHVNAPFRLECVKTKVPKCYEDIKKEYYKAVDGKTEIESVIANMERDIQLHFVTMLQTILKAHSCIKRLDEIAFKHHPWSDVSYIDNLIESEKQDKKPGFEKRVHYYREVRKQAELISKTQQLPQQLSPEEEREWWKEFLSMNSNDSDELVAALPHVKF